MRQHLGGADQHATTPGGQLGISRTALWIDLRAADYAYCKLQNACILTAPRAPLGVPRAARLCLCNLNNGVLGTASKSRLCANLCIHPDCQNCICALYHTTAMCLEFLTEGVPGTTSTSRLCATTSRWYSFKACAPCCSTQVLHYHLCRALTDGVPGTASKSRLCATHSRACSYSSRRPISSRVSMPSTIVSPMCSQS